jgi:hypothetical protein
MYSLLKSSEKLLLLQGVESHAKAEDRIAAVTRFYAGSKALIGQCLIDSIVDLDDRAPNELIDPCTTFATAMSLRHGTSFGEHYGVYSHAAACAQLGASILRQWTESCLKAAREDIEEIDAEIAILNEREAEDHANDLATEALMDQEVA